ncbi:alcohol dehydrogenase catalytic domain-containing protein [Streptomyces sp. NPDC006134]|uniref:zinc-dependent alcohol dehydrogenase n=1 Tax=Streptomyces sp. NPDC006134 TaxID=3154467 RepID=UPI0033C43FD4
MNARSTKAVTYAVEIPAPGIAPRLVRRPRPVPTPGEVLVRCLAVGVCGSDLDLLDGTRPPGFARYPVIPGHEIAATVAEAPAGSGLRPGQHVAVAGMRWCGRCARCADGQQNLCLGGYAELGFTEPGGLAGHLTVPLTQVYPLPPGLDPRAGVLLEPAAVMCLALTGLPPLAGRTAAVVGDGTLGLIAVQLLRAYGAAHITAYGRSPRRLELATACGADRTVVTDGREPAPGPAHDVVVEAAGHPDALATALTTARPGGHVVLTGVAGAWPALEPDLLVVRHLTVRGSVGSTPASWRRAVDLTAAGQLRPHLLLGPCFPLADTARAYAAARTGAPGDASGGGVKTVITHPQEEHL